MYFDDKLELLDAATDYFRGKVDLSDAYLIACQHIVPSTHRLLLSLMQLGLRKENAALVGKCYSTSSLVMRNLIEGGFRVDASSRHYDSHQPFDEDFRENLRRFLRKQLTRWNPPRDSRLIVLDDGGELLQIAARELAEFPNVLGVEQTSSGFNKLKRGSFPFPIVNVARSRAKLILETPMIADSQVRTLETNVLRRAVPQNKILILGHGYIGAALRERLRPRFETVDMWDIQSSESAPLLDRYDLIIGTSGATSVAESEHAKLRKGAVLISASSSDREFDAVHLRRRIAPVSDCHADLEIDGITLVNSGFPVNFYGSLFDNVPLRDIQLTFALLLAGVCQGRPQAVTGFIELDEHLQDLIFDVYARREGDQNRNVAVTGRSTPVRLPSTVRA